MTDIDVKPAASSKGRIGELVAYFLRLGTIGFGGPVALVGQMERELVQERKWLTKEEMRQAIAVCQTMPGPLAIQVGIFISYLRGGFWGPGRAAGHSSCPTFLSSRGWALYTFSLRGCHGWRPSSTA